MIERLGRILLACALSVFAGTASAAVIDVSWSEELPEDGTEYYDLDGDGTTDIGLAEHCCYDEALWISGEGFATEFQFAFVSAGDLIDDTMAWVSNTDGYTTDIPTGLSYIATRGTSIGAYYGYFTVEYDSEDIFLTGFSYEDSGRFITVASPTSAESVPAPATLLIVGLGLWGIGLSRRKH